LYKAHATLWHLARLRQVVFELLPQAALAGLQERGKKVELLDGLRVGQQHLRPALPNRGHDHQILLPVRVAALVMAAWETQTYARAKPTLLKFLASLAPIANPYDYSRAGDARTT
jgi:hypothetical protein